MSAEGPEIGSEGPKTGSEGPKVGSNEGVRARLCGLQPGFVRHL